MISLKDLLSQDKRFAKTSLAHVATGQIEWPDINLEILGHLLYLIKEDMKYRSGYNLVLDE
jgi:hypothetical protein